MFHNHIFTTFFISVIPRREKKLDATQIEDFGGENLDYHYAVTYFTSIKHSIIASSLLLSDFLFAKKPRRISWTLSTQKITSLKSKESLFNDPWCNRWAHSCRKNNQRSFGTNHHARSSLIEIISFKVGKRLSTCILSSYDALCTQCEIGLQHSSAQNKEAMAIDNAREKKENSLLPVLSRDLDFFLQTLISSSNNARTREDSHVMSFFTLWVISFLLNVWHRQW